MPLQNRVTPFGEIVANASRGTLMGNRGGRIHDPATKTLLPRRWTSKRWIACRLDFKDRRREVMGAGYTELFFLDEATALASGHRPCFECRREEAKRFAACWSLGQGLGHIASADEMDALLHAERLAIFRGDRVSAGRRSPAGVIVATGDQAFLCTENGYRRWSFVGYSALQENVGDRAYTLTPPSIVLAIANGYPPS